jgi:glycosyltransferase involved in cell wall biosynthesis
VITVCICTYNRAALLARALERMAAQIGVVWSDVDVLIVDNNCTDQTADVVACFEGRMPIRRVLETSQGLSHARNRALAEATGEWIVFTDDDVMLEDGWLAAYQTGLEAFPNAGYAAGRVIPDWGGKAPGWFHGEKLAYFDGLLVWCDMGQDDRYLDMNEQGLVGASFAVRRAALASGMRFREDLGHKGGTFGRGEETEFVLRLQERGVRGAYIGRALCRHPVEYQRLTLKGLYVHGLASGRAERRIGAGRAQGSPAAAGLFLVRGLVQLARGRGDRARQCLINAGVEMGLSE